MIACYYGSGSGCLKTKYTLLYGIFPAGTLAIYLTILGKNSFLNITATARLSYAMIYFKFIEEILLLFSQSGHIHKSGTLKGSQNHIRMLDKELSYFHLQVSKSNFSHF